jgi:hypothetical protein
MTREISESQSNDAQLQQLANKEGYSTQLVENMKIFCKDVKPIIPKDLQPKHGTTITYQDQCI